MIASFTRFSRFRRWGYTLFVIVGALRIPAQAHFRLHAPLCDFRMAWDNSRLSLTKVPHFVLLGVFFLFTAWQFDRPDLGGAIIAMALPVPVILLRNRAVERIAPT